MLQHHQKKIIDALDLTGTLWFLLLTNANLLIASALPPDRLSELIKKPCAGADIY